MSHGEEGDRKTTSEEQNEVNSQLVSKQKHMIIKRQNKNILGGWCDNRERSREGREGGNIGGNRKYTFQVWPVCVSNTEHTREKLIAEYRICVRRAVRSVHYLLLMEKGRLSPGGGRPSPPLLMAEVEKFLVDMRARLATWANISGSEISPHCKYKV